MLLIGCTRIGAKSHLLGLLAENAMHFDHLIVLAASDDIYLRSRCNTSNGNFVLVTSPPASAWNADAEIKTFGNIFAAALPDIKGQNHDYWVLFFDCCICLPSDFRASLDRIIPSLSTTEIYRPLSCRNCTTFREFQAIAARGEWRSRAHSAIRDGIHLRHGSQCEALELSRFDVRHEPVFAERKLPRVPKDLPITVLKLSSAEVFCGGQGEILQVPKSSPSRQESVICNFLRDLAQFDGRSRGIVVGTSATEVGISEGMHIVERLSFVQETCETLSSTMGVRSERDRMIELRKAIEFYSPDFLLLFVEPGPEMMLELIPCIVQAISKPTWVAGWGYGRPSYPDLSLTIEISAGPPSFRRECGSWAIQLRPLHDSEAVLWPCIPPLPRSPYQIERAEPGDSGLLMYVPDLRCAPRVIEMLALYRSHWQGAIRIVTYRNNDFRLRLAAARFGACFRVLDDPASPRSTSDVGVLVPESLDNRGYCSSCLRSAAWVFLMRQSSFVKTMLLLPSANFYDPGPIMKDDFLEDSIRISEGDESSAIEAVAFRRGSPTIETWETSLKKWMKGELGPQKFSYPHILRDYAKQTLRPTPRSESRLSDSERLWRQKTRIRPVLPPLVPIVTAANKSDLSMLAENWRMIDWGARPVVILDFQATEESSPDFFGDPPPKLVRIGGHRSNEDAALAALEVAAAETDAGWIAFVAPYLVPLPGAHLYESVPPDDVAYVAAGYRFERKLGGSVERIPHFGEPATLVNRVWFGDALKAYRSEKGDLGALCNFEGFAFAYAVRQRRQIWNTNLESCGWAV